MAVIISIMMAVVAIVGYSYAESSIFSKVVILDIDEHGNASIVKIVME
jgi:hypothetical protein